MNDLSLIKQLCSLHAPSGEEDTVFNFCEDWLLTKDQQIYIDRKSVFNAMIVKKGQPTFAIITHADSVGFIKEYEKKVLPIGSPEIKNESVYVKTNKNIQVEIIKKEEEKFYLKTNLDFETGTTFSFVSNFNTINDIIEASYLDNRLNIGIMLKYAIENENVLWVLTSNEEISGGCTEKVARVLYEQYKIDKALIVDTTFESEGIKLGRGVALTLKDAYIPSMQLVRKVRNILDNENIPIQLEVAEYGSSDGAYISKSPYPIQWCFLGIACKDYHSPFEKVNILDVEYMKRALNVLLTKL